MPITAAKAYGNNEVALIAWWLDAPVADCLGFEITRIYLDTAGKPTGDERVLAAWVPFKGQTNKDWKAQTTSVWPVQKLIWRDLTVRRRRDQATLRDAEAKVKYRIRPLVPPAPGLQPVTNLPAKTYEGNPVPLAYADEGLTTNDILITTKHGNVSAAFTNGILSTQWLSHALGNPTKDEVIAHIQKEGDQIRQYLTGDVLGMVRELLERAGQEDGAKVKLALYELEDEELQKLLVARSQQVRLILSNTSKDSKTNEWDNENSASRSQLKNTPGLEIHDRMFNNAHIGHNKFAVLIGADGTPKAVMTGSTNWTFRGMCAQSNNAVIIESPELAKEYSDFWDRLLNDTNLFTVPAPLSAGTKNVQGPEIRAANAQPLSELALADNTDVTLWCAPNTAAKTKKDDVPPDLAAVYSMMRKANDAILFAVFLPSRSGKTSIIEEAISLGTSDPSLIVYGAVSDPMAMPNYVPPPPKGDGGDGEEDQPKGKKPPQPAVYDKGNIHIVRAAALTSGDVVGDFEAELPRAGIAIIHDKIVVVDPLSDTGFVVMGSHNLGYKASYENDENLLIIRNNPTLVQAYAVHVMDLYDHYRYRAVQMELQGKGKQPWDGFLSRDAKWLDAWFKPDKSSLARYFSGVAKKVP